MDEQNNQQKIPLPQWHYIVRPILLYVSSILIFAIWIGNDDGLGTPLSTGAAVGFGFIVMWIIQTIISSKRPRFKYVVSIKKLMMTGVYSFVFLIIWLVAILVIF